MTGSSNRAATIDHLTGVLNRRSFEHRLLTMPVDGDRPVV